MLTEDTHPSEIWVVNTLQGKFYELAEAAEAVDLWRLDGLPASETEWRRRAFAEAWGADGGRALPVRMSGGGILYHHDCFPSGLPWRMDVLRAGTCPDEWYDWCNGWDKLPERERTRTENKVRAAAYILDLVANDLTVAVACDRAAEYYPFSASTLRAAVNKIYRLPKAVWWIDLMGMPPRFRSRSASGKGGAK